MSGIDSFLEEKSNDRSNQQLFVGNGKFIILMNGVLSVLKKSGKKFQYIKKINLGTSVSKRDRFVIRMNENGTIGFKQFVELNKLIEDFK